MGIFGSSEENHDEKTIDSTGHVNTNIVIQEAGDIHEQLLQSAKLLNATYVLVFLELIKLGIYLFTSMKKSYKKKYGSSSNSTSK